MTAEPRLQVTAADRAEAAAALAADDRPLVVLHPRANDPRRRWPVERLAVVGSELARKGARLAVVGTADRAAAGRPATGHARWGRGRSDRPAWARRSGRGAGAGRPAGWQRLGTTAHAAALGTATVAVYWCVSLGSSGPLYRARHRAPTAWRLHCPICGANGLHQDCRSSHDVSFVADVTTEEVLAESLDLLATETARASTQ